MSTLRKEPETTVSGRVSVEVSSQVEALARALKRSKSSIVGEAVRRYVAEEQQFLEAIDEGIRALEAGDVVDHETVRADMRRRLDAYSSAP